MASYNSSVTLTWLVPCETNGIIESFEGSFSGSRQNMDDHNFEWTLDVTDGDVKDYYAFTEYRLYPEMNYNVSIKIKIVDSATYSQESYDTFESPAGSE